MHWLARARGAIAGATNDAKELLRLAGRLFSSTSEPLRADLAWIYRVFHWDGDCTRLRKRHEPYRRRLCFEGLEPRRPLSYTLIVGAYIPGGIDTITSDQNVSNLLDSNTGLPSALPRHGADVIIPAGLARVNIENAAGQPKVTFASLTLAPSTNPASVMIAPETGSDEIYVDPANAMDLIVSSAGDTMTFSTPFAPLSAGTTVLNTAGNSGTAVIDGTASVDTLYATAGSFKISSNAVVNATTATASAGTLDVEGTLNIAANGNGLSIENNATLQGAGTISLDAGCPLLYQSSQSSELHAKITGSGYLDVACGSDATFVLYAGNDYLGGTRLDSGTLQLGDSGALPGYTPLRMYGAGKLDMNGFDAFVETLYSNSASTLITNNSTSIATLYIEGINPGSSTSTFAGTIADGNNGAGQIYLQLVSFALTLTGTADFSAGTNLDAGWIDFACACTNRMLSGSIIAQDESSITFDVAAGATETFTGYITWTDGNVLTLTKQGPGMLVLDPSQPCSYFSTELSGGTLAYANAYAVPPQGSFVSSITVDGGATLNVGSFSPAPAFQDVTLDDGIITGAALMVAANGVTQGGTVTVGHGRIDASMSGPAAFDKEEGGGASNGVPANTVIIGGDCSGLTGVGTVAYGRLEVDGKLGSSALTVRFGATLQGSGECVYAVTINGGATLALGGADGTFTLGALALQPGATIEDNIQARALVLAKIDGALTINGATTVNFVENGSSGVAAYQELFRYNSGEFNPAQFAYLTLGQPPAGVAASTKVNDTPNNSIDIAFGTPLFWSEDGTDRGGPGEWNAGGYNWLPASGGAAIPWASRLEPVFPPRSRGSFF